MNRRSFLKGLGALFALPVVTALAPRLPEPVSPPLPLGPKPGSEEWKRQVIREMLSTPEGRSKLAASMTQPLRRQRDYAAVGRKVFTVEPMPSSRVEFPIFEIASCPEISLEEIRKRRFDLRG